MENDFVVFDDQTLLRMQGKKGHFYRCFKFRDYNSYLRELASFNLKVDLYMEYTFEYNTRI